MGDPRDKPPDHQKAEIDSSNVTRAGLKHTAARWAIKSTKKMSLTTRPPYSFFKQDFLTIQMKQSSSKKVGRGRSAKENHQTISDYDLAFSFVVWERFEPNQL